ncbi:hypothetical protein [Pontibacter vulgaris]|uniref:hypothetical protein n=1 Tax=Pontibacter vulgaris TaxID=2905679 RepID=UPI001FA7366E|nr:hypothetical protein [Pontibacter vulgaris]
MENKENRTTQSSVNQTPQSRTQSNTSTSGISSQSQSGTSGIAGLNNITDKLQQFSNTTLNKVSSLSTTQKVVGGSLLALGAGWVAMNSMKKGKNKTASNKNQNRS